MISIIVPVWNAEKFLPQMIQSVLCQSYSKWEMLLVDDGSTDDSLVVCNKFANRDDRIKVWSKKNNGVSSARNYGIKKAKGDWFYFMDSDDWIEEKCLEIAVSEGETGNYDIVCWNFFSNVGVSEKKAKAICPPKQVFSSPKELCMAAMFPQYIEKKRQCSLGAIRSMCTKLIRSDIVIQNKLFFDETMAIGEDALFCAESFGTAKKVLLIDEYLYHYREHTFSANQRYREDAIEVYENALDAFVRVWGGKLGAISYATCYKGMVWSYVNRIMDKKITHSDNQSPRRQKILELSKFLRNSKVKLAFQIETDENAFRQNQKIMLHFIKNEKANLLYIMQKLKRLIK